MTLQNVVDCAKCLVTDETIITQGRLFNGIGQRVPVLSNSGYRVVNVVGAGPCVLRNVVSRTVRSHITIHYRVCPDKKPFACVLTVIKDSGNLRRKHFKILCTVPNLEWRRFVVCKELMQVLTFQAVANPAGYAFLQAYQTGYATFKEHLSLCSLAARSWQKNIPQGGQAELDVETACFYMAVEVLVPCQLQEPFVAFHNTVGIEADAPWTYSEIKAASSAFLVPQDIFKHIVRRTFSEDGRVFEPYCYVSARLRRNERFCPQICAMG